MSGPRRRGNALTEKLREYLCYSAQGMSHKEIARKTNITYQAVDNRMKRVMPIIGCLTRAEVIAYAKEHPSDCYVKDR